MSYLHSLLTGKDYTFNHDHIDVQVLDQGVLQLSPPQAKDKLGHVILSCGIHGNETAPIEMLDLMLEELLAGKLSLNCHLLMIFGHPEAMQQQERFIDFNLNRLFSGEHQHHPQARESARAHLIEQHVQQFLSQSKHHQIHLDLHTAIAKSHHPKFCVCPAFRKDTFNNEVLEQLSSLGLDALILNSEESTTFSYYTQTLIKSRGFSATIELGKVMPFGENKASDFQQAKDSLYHLVGHGFLPRAEVSKLFQVKRALIRDVEEYELYLEKPYFNFTLLDPTQALEQKQEGLTYPQDNEYIIFPNPKVKIGQRSGLIIELIS